MSKTTREVVLRYKGRIELSSLADQSKVESAGAKFFDQAGQFCASLVVAWPRRLEFTFPDGDRVIFSKPRLKGPLLTEAQKKIVRELLMPMHLEFCEAIARTEADREKIRKNKEEYEKAVFGKSLKNKRQRAGAEFLRGLQLAELYHRENSSRGSQALPVIALIRTVYGSPLFEGLVGNDTEFVQGILKQMGHSQSERQKLKKRLIEIDELRHPAEAAPTWKDIWQKHCPDHIDTPQNFQHLLDECGIPYSPVGEFDRKRVQNRIKNTR